MTFKELLDQRGTATKLAKSLGVTHSAVLQWASRRVPAERVLMVEALTGISRQELRPDLYPPYEQRVPQQAAYSGPERRQMRG
jgi:DNA-binding transcriptional regulator YdaS (Cro superfamily)